MAGISDIANQVFEDGAPPEAPNKGAIRALFKEVENQVGAAQAGSNDKPALRAASSTNVALSAIYNGQTVGGVVLATNDRFGLFGQSTGSQNGAVVVPSSSGTPARVSDLDTGTEFVDPTLGKAVLYVKEGTLAGTTWKCSNTTAPVVDTDAITFILVTQTNTAKPAALDSLRAQSSSIAAAATTDLSTATGDLVTITGTATITALGTMPSGVERKVIFTGAPTLVHNATSLRLPGGTSQLVQVNDPWTFTSLGSGNWVATSYPGRLRLEPADEVYPDTSLDPRDLLPPTKARFKDDGSQIYLLNEVLPSDEAFPGRAIDDRDLYSPSMGGTASSGPDGGLTLDLCYAQDASAAAQSANVANRPIPVMAGYVYDYMMVHLFGQSLEMSGKGHPPKTTTPPPWGVSLKMLGNSVRPGRDASTNYPFGTTLVLNPAVATMDIPNSSAGSDGVVYDPATFVQFPDSGMNGESPGIAFGYEVGKRINEGRQEVAGNLNARQMIVGVHGLGDTSLANLLSTSNLPSLAWSARLRSDSYATQLKSHVNSTYPGKTYGIAFAGLDQGQKDANDNNTYAAYYASLGDWLTMIRGYCAAAGQAEDPFFRIHQSANHWVLNKPAIPQAHSDFALANPTVFMTMSNYATPAKMVVQDGSGNPIVGLPTAEDGHKDANAYRWAGAYDAKVYDQVVIRRRYWEHMHLVGGRWGAGTTRAVLSWGGSIVGGLRIREAFNGYHPVLFSDLGINFRQGTVPITFLSYQLLGTNSILFTLDRVPTAGVPLIAQIGVARGATNIFDNDPAVSRFSYVHSHQDYAAKDPNPANMTANEIAIDNDVQAALAAYIGKPYPLPNMAAIEEYTLTEVAA